MFVKIIKCKGWYSDKYFLNSIFEVTNNERDDASYLCKCDKYRFIKKQDCEIIDINNDQISEEFARELLSNIFKNNLNISVNGYIKLDRNGIVDYWKQEGYIKQSREDELREKISKLTPSYEVGLCLDLIEILDNKPKENK
jgi:hypothetical protein